MVTVTMIMTIFYFIYTNIGASLEDIKKLCLADPKFRCLLIKESFIQSTWPIILKIVGQTQHFSPSAIISNLFVL